MTNQLKPAPLSCALAGAAPGAITDVKIGFLATLSAPSADNGRDQFDAFSLALGQLGGKSGGVPATIVKEDVQQKPEVALSALSKLLERDKVDVVTGLTFANVLVALQAKIASTDVPFIGSVAGLSALAGAQCKPNLFVTYWQGDAPAEAARRRATSRIARRSPRRSPAHRSSPCAGRSGSDQQLPVQNYTCTRWPMPAASRSSRCRKPTC